MQILLVAFSRRMCCSRVCRARRYAGRPSASTLTPTKRPGRERSRPDRTAIYPACGPPKAIGTPYRCIDPTAISAPSAPGERRSVRANGSASMTTSAPRAFADDSTARGSTIRPVEAGYASTTPDSSPSTRPWSGSNSTISISTGSARV